METESPYNEAPPAYQLQPMRRRKPWLLWLIILLALGGGAYWVFGGASKSSNEKGGVESKADGKRGPQSTPVVSVVTTARADIPVYLDGLGTIQAYNNVTVHAQVDGQLLALNFTEGQEVKAGDVLAQIDPRLYQAAYDQAVANQKKDAATLENAKRDLERYAGLGNAIAQQTVDTQKSSVSQAAATVAADAAAVASAKTQLSYTTITAPIDGRTGIRNVDVGNIIKAGDTNGIVTITQVKPISVLFSLPQQVLPQLMTAQQKGTVTVLATDAQGKVLDTGALVLVDNQIDQATGTVKLKATLPNESLALWPGAFTNVRLLADTMVNALYIPAAAIQRGPNSTYVFIFNPADHSVKMQDVEVALNEDQVAVITKGLSDGDQVVTDNAGKLTDGSKVALPGETPSPADKKTDKKEAGGAPPAP